LNTWLYPLLGACSLLAFAPFDLFVVAWFCLIPLLIVGHGKPWYRHFLEGYLYGIGFYGIGLNWLPQSIAAFMGFSSLLSWLGFAAIVGFLALFPAMFKWLLSHITPGRLRLLVIAPALWTLLEVVRFSTWGGLPWLNLAVTQINGPLAPWFAVIGETGVTLLIVVINGVIFLLGQRLFYSDRKVPARQYLDISALLGTAIVAGLALGQIRWVTPSANAIELGVVQAAVPGRHDFAHRQHAKILKDYRSLTDRITPAADLVVLPESTIRLKVTEWGRYLKNPLVSGSDYLIGALETTVAGNPYNSSFLMAQDGYSVYRKQRLVPIAEQRNPWLTSLFGPDTYRAKPMLRGRISEPLGFGSIELGLAICWEIRFTNVLANSVRAGADMLINQANESWLYSDVARSRLLAVARMRAAENGRMLVRSVNQGSSAIIDVTGKVIEKFPSMQQVATIVQAMPHDGKTPYVKYHVAHFLNLISFLIMIMGFRYRLAKYGNAETASIQQRSTEPM